MEYMGQIKNSNSRPVERVMDSAFTKMRNLVEADVIVGSPIMTADGASIIPINKVTMGFVTGGGEYSDKLGESNSFPFAGGSGGGMTVSPICFLVSTGQTVELININEKPSVQEKLLEKVPEAIGQIIRGIVKKNGKK